MRMSDQVFVYSNGKNNAGTFAGTLQLDAANGKAEWIADPLPPAATKSTHDSDLKLAIRDAVISRTFLSSRQASLDRIF